MYFNYPFLKNNIVTFQDGRHNAYLSFVLHTLFSFQGAISELLEFRFQYLLISTEI